MKSSIHIDPWNALACGFAAYCGARLAKILWELLVSMANIAFGAAGIG